MIDEDIKKLEELAKKMEQGTLNLEQSLQVFQEGISLIRKCTTTLESAELRVKEIIETQGGLQAIPFQKS
jgi:exodeoxyribonuclease VII small subunit